MLNIKNIEFFEKVETPFYFYDMDILRATIDKVASLSRKYDIQAHYAIKANVEPRILELISSAGLGADCVSGNEVTRALSCGFPADKVVFAGVGKSDKEIAEALKAGIESFNCESLQEIYVINALAGRLGLRARVSARINPNIDAHTHRYVTTGLYENKFGISDHEFDALVNMVKRCPNVDFMGLHFHVGSQITQVNNVYSLECERVNSIVAQFEAKGLEIKDINLGGGLGVNYEDPDAEPIPDFDTWFSTVAAGVVRKMGQRVHIEPGRSIVAQSASLVSRVLFVKSGETKTFLILDAGMNDLIRPALYGAYHKIENLSARLRPNLPHTQVYDIVGPVCESSDVWGAGRLLPLSVRGDLMAIRSTGAYGQVMSSRYNLKDFAPAVYSDDMHGARLRTEYFDN